ncbi:ornithine cyclodeaminase family protein [Facklamia sp. P12932]|uniref:ornithine cyclodeaminase family protein n=1 Tax=Facklamia sp. P12932 TaxID=3421947 RepID=UPI003D169B87
MKKKDTILITNNQVTKVLNDIEILISLVEKSFLRYTEGKTILPEKNSQIFDEMIQNRINCMPATLIEEKVAGVKWVSVFPNNPMYGLDNVNGLMILSEIESGQPIAVMDCAALTSIRTASVGACALKYLSKKNPDSIGFIGSGAEARAHFKIIKDLFPTIASCFVSSNSFESNENFIKDVRKQYSNVNYINCEDNFEKAVFDSDIIVTATSAQKPLLKESWIKSGATYVHVGGYEDEYNVALSASKIVCDKWENVKHRGSQTISKMYKSGLLTDENIYADLSEIIAGKKIGRENEDEFIYFNSVGLAYIDVMIANYVYECYRDKKDAFKFQFKDS